MKKLVLALALLLGIGVAANFAQDVTPGDKTTAVKLVATPSMKLHKELEKHAVAMATETARHTVSVEIDYDRDDVGGAEMPSLPGIPGMGPDMSDPFYRYDIGPFSGLVVGDNHILISDRTLGDFNDQGASDAVTAITVTLPNGERWPARVVGRHQQIDLALIEIDCVMHVNCPVLKPIEFPKADAPLKTGQSIMVVGRGQNPLGTLVTDGIVSAVDRENGRAFQIDARVGNSTLGAPVVDKHGHPVGIVTLHNHQTFGQASGVSYAAYIGDVAEAYEEMKEGKFIAVPPSPFMGIGATKKWPDKPGLEVGNVVAGTGAAKAGLRIGDIITKVNDTDMNDVPDLIKIINEQEVGDTMTVTIIRGEEELDVKVTLGPRP